MTFALSALRGRLVYTELAEKCRAQSIPISSVPNLAAGGSGTLATYKNLCGILSATHVFADDINTTVIYSPLQKTNNPATYLNIPIQIKKVIYLETTEGIKALQGEY